MTAFAKSESKVSYDEYLRRMEVMPINYNRMQRRTIFGGRGDFLLNPLGGGHLRDETGRPNTPELVPDLLKRAT
jgi:hypothetical protein